MSCTLPKPKEPRLTWSEILLENQKNEIRGGYGNSKLMYFGKESFKSPNPLEQLEQPIPIPTVETDGLSLIDWLFPICEICSKRHFILQNKKITSKHVCRSCYFMFDINSEKRLNLVKQVRYNVVKKIKENCYDN